MNRASFKNHRKQILVVLLIATALGSGAYAYLNYFLPSSLTIQVQDAVTHLPVHATIVLENGVNQITDSAGLARFTVGPQFNTRFWVNALGYPTYNSTIQANTPVKVIMASSPTVGRTVTPGNIGPCTWFVSLDGTTPVAEALVSATVSGNTYSPGDNYVGTAGQDAGAFLNLLWVTNIDVCLSTGTFNTSTVIVPLNNDVLEGSGHRSTQLVAAAGLNIVIDINAHEFVTVKSLYIAIGTSAGAVGIRLQGTAPAPARYNYIEDVFVFAAGIVSNQAGFYLATDVYWNDFVNDFANGERTSLAFAGTNGHGANANFFTNFFSAASTECILIPQYSDTNIFSGVSCESYTAYAIDIGGAGTQMTGVQWDTNTGSASLMRLTATANKTYVIGHSISTIGSNTVADSSVSPNINRYRITVVAPGEPVGLVQGTVFASSTTTAGASVWTGTNNNPWTEVWVLTNLNGGTVSAISYRGTAGFPTTTFGFNYILEPGQSITVTWATTAPTFTRFPLDYP